MRPRAPLAAALVLALAAGALAQDRRRGPPTPDTLPPTNVQKDAEKIAWHGTWSEAQAEARRTGRPILLVSAAPHCRNISGVW